MARAGHAAYAPIVFYPPLEQPEPSAPPVRPPPPPLALHTPLPPSPSQSPPLPPIPAGGPPGYSASPPAFPGAQPAVGGQMGTEAEQSAFGGLMEEMRAQQERVEAYGGIKGEKEKRG